MPKAKPVSLYPLSFDDALKALISVDPARVRIPPKKSQQGMKRPPATKKKDG